MNDKAISAAAAVEDLYDPALVDPRFSALLDVEPGQLGLLTTAVGLCRMSGVSRFAPPNGDQVCGFALDDHRAISRLMDDQCIVAVILDLVLSYEDLGAVAQGSSHRGCTNPRQGECR